jgi:Protein of unknown function (DUF3302)/Superinfection immunity protein
MLGFDLGIWDFITFAVVFIITAGAVTAAVLLLGLPGRIAVARKHPDAEAVTLLGWAGGFAVLPWMQALIWAFKPTDIIDIRRFPPEVQSAIAKELAKLQAVDANVSAGQGGAQSPTGESASTPL